jgi:2'-5' RNA ligase
MTIRSFLAFELPPGIREVVDRVCGELVSFPLDIKWVKPRKIHQTVVFMGNIREEDLPAIKETIRAECGFFAPFSISLKGVGLFPNRNKPRVLWLGLDCDQPRLNSFRDRLQSELTVYGVKEEKRRFSPHLTLGRFRRPGRHPLLKEIAETYAELTSPAVLLEELILFRSDLRPTGAVYTKLERFPLKGEQ